MRRILILPLTILAAALVLPSDATAWAQGGSSEKTSANKAAPDKASSEKATSEKGKGVKNRPMPGVTPEREAAVMTFVKQHHPELADLLVQLKSSSSKEYEKGVRELFRASERLAQIQERDLEQYELELKLWQAQSRVQLLSARVKMSDSKDLREQLKLALSEQLDLRLALLRRERERLSDRVGDIDLQLQKMEGNRKQLIDRQLGLLAGSDKANAEKPVSKPAPGKKNNSTEKDPRASPGGAKTPPKKSAGS